MTWMPIRKSHVQTADAARDARQWDVARVHYEAALSEDPTLGPIWVQLAHVRKEHGDLDGAEAAYRRALTLQPNVADTQIHLAHVLKRLGKQDEAVHAFAEAVRLQPGIGDAEQELVRLGYTSTGRRVFGAEFMGPLSGHRSEGAMLLIAHAKLSGITAAEALRLHTTHGLQLGGVLHEGTSGKPAGPPVTARLHRVEEYIVKGHFLFSHDTRQMSLARVGFFHEAEVDKDWPVEAWMRVDVPDDSLTGYYRSLTGTSYT